jgi:predicted nuclease of predicted toxin-antitoxin system
LTFFVDNCLSPKLVRMLQALGEDVKHLRETDDASGKKFAPNTKDVDWIPFVADNGWIAVTSDTAMSRVPIEVAALIKSRCLIPWSTRLAPRT